MKTLLLGSLAIAIPLSAVFTLSVGGTLPLSDILASLCAIPALRMKGRRASSFLRGRRLLVLMLLWCVGELFADLYHHNSMLSTIRGFAAIAFLFLDFMGLWWLLSTSAARLKLFVVAQSLSVLLRALVTPGHNLVPNATFDINWKFGYGDALTGVVLLFVCVMYRKRNYPIVFGAVLSLGLLHMYHDARALSLIVLVSGALLLPFFNRQRARQSDLERRVGGNFLPVVSLFLVVASAAAATGFLYSYSAQRGYLGADASKKYQEQARGRYGLLGGRPENFIDGLVILDSPILGHGSYAQDPRYVNMLQDELLSSGYSEREAKEDPDSLIDAIPVHSHLLQAWIWAGLPGAVFWFYVLYLLGATIFRIANSSFVLAPLMAYIMVRTLWDVLASPFGLDARLRVAFTLVVALGILQQSDSKQESSLARPADGRVGFRPRRSAFGIT